MKSNLLSKEFNKLIPKQNNQITNLMTKVKHKIYLFTIKKNKLKKKI